MKRTIILTGLLLVSVTIISAPAIADRENKSGERITRLDSDGDGIITRAEADAPRLERFSAADTDGDGALTQAELEAFAEAERERRMAERKARRFARMDSDGNGTISIEEFSKRSAGRFDRWDANNDGSVTVEEIEAARAARAEWRENRRAERRAKREQWRNNQD